jgi:saccharopine dehydrogenase-like NADP-dependent oxidoreductase
VRAVVLGVGAVGGRAARQLASTAGIESIVVCDRQAGQAESVARSLGPIARAEVWDAGLLRGASVLVIAAPLASSLAALAPGAVTLEIVEAALGAGVPVVSVADGMLEVQALLRLDRTARVAGVSLVVGAGMAPGLTDLLARRGAAGFEVVEEIHISKAGTAGPACARAHHRALGSEALDWRDGQWARRPGGSGRELHWFPDPVGGRDCYRAGLPDALLVVPAFPGVRRVTARVAATRRDRFTAALPMLRPPHPEGEVGAIRVEVRGVRVGARDVQILGCIDRPGVAAGAVAAVSALWAAEGLLSRPGAAGLGELVDEPGPFLAELARRGVKVAVFEGSAG